MPKKKNFNPFYSILVVAGIAFCLTAFCYGIMAIRERRSFDLPSAVQQSGIISENSSVPFDLMDFMKDYGVQLMIAELVVLAVGTIGAICTDNYWTSKNAASD